METQPIAANDAEQQWIAKYRRALEANIPVPHSRSEPLGRRITDTVEKVLLNVARILEQCTRLQSAHAKTAIQCATRIEHSKLRPHTVSHGPRAGKPTGEKAS